VREARHPQEERLGSGSLSVRNRLESTPHSFSKLASSLLRAITWMNTVSTRQYASLGVACSPSLFHSPSLSHTLTHTLSHCLSLSHTPSLSLSRSLSLSLTHTLSHTPTHTLSLTHSLSHTHIHTHTPLEEHLPASGVSYDKCFHLKRPNQRKLPHECFNLTGKIFLSFNFQNSTVLNQQDPK